MTVGERGGHPFGQDPFGSCHPAEFGPHGPVGPTFDERDDPDLREGTLLRGELGPIPRDPH